MVLGLVASVCDTVGGRSAVLRSTTPTVLPSMLAKPRVVEVQAGLVEGNAAAGILDALPGSHGVHGGLHGSSRHRTGAPLVPVEEPGVATLRAGHAAGEAPGGVAAAVAIVHDGSGSSAGSGVGGSLDAPGVHLLGVPLVTGHEGVAAVVGDGLGAAQGEGGQTAAICLSRISRVAGETLPGADRTCQDRWNRKCRCLHRRRRWCRGAARKQAPPGSMSHR